MQLIPKYNGDSSDGARIILPVSGVYASEFNRGAINQPYTKCAPRRYSAPRKIGMVTDQSFMAAPEQVTDDNGVILKRKGVADCVLPECFASVAELTQATANWLFTHTGPKGYLEQQLTLLFHYYDGYDSEPSSHFHFDPPEPKEGTTYNVFFAASCDSTEYSPTPDPRGTDIKSTEPMGIYYMDDHCFHRRPYLPEGVERNFALIMARR